jgi:ElaB/YqjD/DUF883 family membrane-anchored ribosome-binding protein
VSAPTPAPDGRSIGALIGDISQDVTTLLREELELARVQLRQETIRTGKATATLAGATAAAQLTLLFASVTVCWWLSHYMNLGYAALLIALLWAAVCVALYLNGTHRLRTLRLGPDRRQHRPRSRPGRREIGRTALMTTDAGTGSSRIQDNIEDTREALRNDVDALSERVDPARAVRGGGRRIADTTRDLRERVMGTAQDAAEWMADAGSTATNTLSAAPETARDHTRGHPLAAGLVAFGAGWLLSALLPSTSRERQLGHRATELAADQIGPLTEQAGDVVSSAVANLREPVENAAGTVRTTARSPRSV